MIVGYAAKKQRLEMPNLGLNKDKKRESILNELMLGPETEHILDRIQSLVSLLRGHMIPEIIGDNADNFKNDLQDFSRILEVIKTTIER